MKKTKNQAKSKVEVLEDLTKQHGDLSMDIALLSIRINAMEKNLDDSIQDLLGIEASMERLTAEINGGGAH